MKLNTLGKILLLFPVMFLLLVAAYSQETDSLEVEKTSLELSGVWKMDLPEQKSRLEPENQTKIKQLSPIQEENLWMEADSRVYVLDPSGRFHLSWVREGALNELRGKWQFDSDSMIIRMEWENGVSEYRVTIKPKGMLWVSVAKSEDFFQALHLKSLVR